jgi:hypothetical protein
VCVVQLVRLAKVCEWNHAWNQRNASPPEVRGFCATEMTVYRLVRHHRAEKNQIGSEQNVEHDEQRISDGNQERPDREQSDDTDDRSAEIVDFGTALHGVSLGKFVVGQILACGS